MDKPKEAIERVRVHSRTWNKGSDMWTILAYLDWLEGKHVCEWPIRLNEDFLMNLAAQHDSAAKEEALRALAAVAPQKRKRMAELWIHERGQKEWLYSDDKWTAQRANMPGWKCLARNIELEE